MSQMSQMIYSELCEVVTVMKYYKRGLGRGRGKEGVITVTPVILIYFTALRRILNMWVHMQKVN